MLVRSLKVVKGIVMICEAGAVVFDEGLATPLSSATFEESNSVSIPAQLQAGELPQKVMDALMDAQRAGVTTIVSESDRVRASATTLGLSAEAPDEALSHRLQSLRLELMVKGGLVSSLEEGRERVRRHAIAVATARLKEMAVKPDLQIVHAVQALDELDKSVNVLGTRVREWYGLHFPELLNLIEEPTLFSRAVSLFGGREGMEAEGLAKLGVSQRRAEAIVTASSSSKGGDISKEDLSRLRRLSEEVLHLSTLREALANHLDREMERLAPNISSVAGPTIGARILARAGGLDRLARLPASTVQVLGAEKALFRALRTGTRPPKHGILFQHQEVHSAPPWQRGKMARSIATKLAIAARVDAFRGVREPGLEERLKKRIEEIKVKYREPPRSKRGRGFERKKERRKAGMGRV